MNTEKIRLGIQMFDFAAGGDWEKISSMEEISDLLRQLKEVGYDGVEWCSFMLGSEYMDLVLLKEMMDRIGLKTCGMHFHYQNADTFEKDCAEAVERCRVLESPYLIFAFSIPQTFGIEPEKPETEHPFANKEPLFTSEQIDAWIKEADHVIEAMKAACEGTGIEVLYHNHADELRKGTDGDRFFDAIHPDGREVDVYWVAKGMDGRVSTALDYVREHRSEVRLLHIKDGLNGSVFPNEMCGWGKGTYPIQEIIECARELNLKWVVVENDAPQNFGTSGLEDAIETGTYVKEHIRL